MLAGMAVLVMLLTPWQMAVLRYLLPPLSHAMNWLESWPIPIAMDMDHVAFFALVGVGIRIALPGVRWWRLLIVLAALATGTELLQFFSVGRTPKLLDARDDVLGASIGLLLGMVPLWCARQGMKVLRLADAALLAAVVLLPVQQWSVASAFGFPLLASDVLFLFALGLRGFALATGVAPVRIGGFHGWLAAYVLAMALALLVLLPAGDTAPPPDFVCALPSPNYMAAVGKWIGIVWLVVIAGLAFDAATREGGCRRLVLAWLAGAVIAAVVSWLAILAFYFAGGSGGWDSLVSNYGSLPPGPYPRVRGLFADANMAGLYLLLSIGLALVAHKGGWLARRRLGVTLALLSGPLLATASQAIGATILLLAGGWFRAGPALKRSRSVVLGLGVAAGLGILSLLLINPAAPFVLPSVRMQIWYQAWLAWQGAFWRGNGLGQAPVGLTYLAPDGGMQYLTDAHNIVLSLGAQGGMVAVAAFIGLVAWIAWQARRVAWLAAARVALLLAVGYLGLGGAFEDARVLWVFMGLLAGAIMTRDAPVAPRACAP